MSPDDLKVGDKTEDGSLYMGRRKDGRRIFMMAHEGPRLSYYDALRYAADLDVHGHHDWKLPHVDDVPLLRGAFEVVASKSKVYYEPEGHWLSTQSGEDSIRAVLVHETNGEALLAEKHTLQPVRCIRYE